MQQLRTLFSRREFNRPALQILVDLIRIASGYRVSLAHTRFGTPVVLDQRPDIKDDANTFVSAEIDESWDASFPKGGDNGFLYFRLPLAALLNGRSVVITSASAFKTHDKLAEINAFLGSQLTAQDLVNQSYFAGTQTLTLQAAPASLVWNNEALPVFEPFNLKDLANLELSGLQYIQPAPAPA